MVVFHGKEVNPCPHLATGDHHVGFNGNRKCKGHGYRLATPGGWLFKAGYALTEVESFLDDLAALTKPLGLNVIGVGPQNAFVPLAEMRGMAITTTSRHTLERLHLRIYTTMDYVERWRTFFHGSNSIDVQPASVSIVKPIEELLAEMKKKGLSQRAVAAGIGEDASYVNKILNGHKPPPKDFVKKAGRWVAKQGAEPKTPFVAPKKIVQQGGTILEEALCHLNRGWSVVPQETGAKKPHVRWKPYQEKLPEPEEWKSWSSSWPDAGLALVLGPVSNVLVIDVDGPEAHDVLRQRLGKEPVAPKVLSGSRQPHRYHLFFRHPDVPTKSKMTPWHPKLEFRGKGGIVIIPPSLHKCGHPYAWAPRRSPDDLPLPELPASILEALQPVVRPVLKDPPRGGLKTRLKGIDASPRTLAFLSGGYANGPGWNDRLFLAACDLCGREMAIDEAEPLLLAGASPWNQGEEERARKTVQSAYSKPREPAQF